MVTMGITKTIKLNTIMKKNFLLIALILCAGLTVQAQLIKDPEIKFQIQDINAPSGIISQTCAEYTNNVNRAWNVNIGQNKKVKIEYYIDTETNYDRVSVYSINALGAATLLFTESGRKSGMRYSEFMTGKIQVVFTSDASISCSGGYPQYTGFNLSFSAGDPIVAEAISGNLPGGALRVQTDYGNLDLGPQNATTAHLSTDRSQFLLNKPLFLQTGTLSSYSTSNMYFQTNGTNRMTILNTNGNVGIGVFSPRACLDVTNNTTNQLKTVLARLGEGTDDGEGTYLGVKSYNTQPVNTKSFSIEHKFFGELNNAINFYRGGGKTGGSVKIAVHDGREICKFHAEGLDVGGTIKAREVKIDINTGADFVFVSDYNLKPLSDVESFIQTNRHLPEIPSEKAMLEDGISINEFQIKLLQKIEELTLYAIEQSKKIEKMEKEIKELKETK